VSHTRSGSATFLFTDIERSTRLLQSLGERYAGVLDEHRLIIRQAVEAAGGRVFGTEGDAVFAAFSSAAGAVAAAAEMQRALQQHDWSGAELSVRIGVHSGEALATGGDYVGLPLHQVARIRDAAYGGQVLVSEATRQLATSLPAGLDLRDLGEHRLKDLARPERLYQLVVDGLKADFPPPNTLSSRPNNLPVQLTSFVGREELAAARHALAGTRLLSLTGPGGTGKTRMALQLAAEASDDFPAGIFFVALDSITEPELVLSVIAATIDLKESAGVPLPERLAEHLRDKRMLLVLDNFEQIVDAGPQVARLLREAPDLKMIVTTRIVLRVSGEQEFPVPPLGVLREGDHRLTAEEAARSEAVLLFVERATAVQPSFALTDENAATIAEITRRLDGLPLAIELAAARVRVLPLSAIAARLDRHLELLTGGARDLPARQQTLRGAIDWSYDLLDEADRRLFERFSVHAGGAFLNEADAVCGPANELGEDVLDGLSSLADKSLVRAELIADEDPRFAMLVTIRDYARQRLDSAGDADQLRRKHALAYLAAVESVADEFIGPQAARWGDRLELDNDNLRQALDWMIEQREVELALRFLAAVWRFWQTRGHLHEARRRIDQVMAMAGIDQQPEDVQYRALAAAGGICYWQSDYRATHDYYSRALEMARRSGDQALIAEGLYNYGFAALDEESPAQKDLLRAGRPYIEQSLELYTELDDARGIANTGWALAAAVVADDPEAAYRYAERSLESFRRLGDPFGTGWALYMLSGYDMVAGRDDLAVERAREALAIFAASRDLSGVVVVLAALWLTAERRGQVERQHRLGGAVEALTRSSGLGVINESMDLLDFRPPEKPVDDPAAMELWQAGARLSVDEAVAYALEETPPGG
jgi:predicted ATPase/class 3 adenylate cyclase